MAFRKGNSDGAAKVLDLLTDLESALTEEGWSDIGQWNEGGFAYHGWRSSAVNSGVIEWVMVFRVPSSGDGDLNIYAGENWRDSDGKIQKPVGGYGNDNQLRTSASQNLTSPYVFRRWWLPRDGGDMSVAAPIGDYALGNPWWWPINAGAAGGLGTCKVRVADDVFTQWMIGVKGDSVHISTYRWNGNTRDMVSGWCVESFVPWVPSGAHVGLSQIWNLTSQAAAINRPTMHPEWQRYIDQGYSDDLDTNPFNRYLGGYDWSYVNPGVHNDNWSYGGNNNGVGDPDIFQRISVAGGGILAQPVPLSNFMYSVFATDPDTGASQGQNTVFNGYLFFAYMPGLRGLATRTDVVNIGDEVEGHDGQRYVFTGITSAGWDGPEYPWMVK